MSQLTATILFSDSACTSANAIQYFSSNASCVEMSSKCVKVVEGLYATNTCVPSTAINSQGISTFGQQYFPKDTPQILSLTAGSNCTDSVKGGWQSRLDACMPALQTEANASSKVTVNSSGAISLSTYGDRNCTITELRDVQAYGSIDAPSCLLNSAVSIINSQGYSITTVYTGSDCNTPFNVQLYIATEVCKESPCSRSENGDYVSYRCAQKVDYNKLVQSAFSGAPSFKVSTYADRGCKLLTDFSSIRLNTCHAEHGVDNIQSTSISMTEDEAFIKYSFYPGTNCQGQVADSELIPTDSTCTRSETIAFNKTLFPTTVPTQANSESGTGNVGVIVGAVVGSLVLLGLIGFVVFWVSRKKPYNNLSWSPVRALDSSTNSYNQPAMDDSTGAGTQSSVSYLVNHNSDKKSAGFVFDAMNSMTEHDVVGVKMPTIGHDGLQYADFGDIRLPAIPSQWTVSQVMLWASGNGATPEILELIQNEQLDGQTFLLMKMDDFNFQFPSLKQRLHFRAGLESLAVLNEERLKTAAMTSISAPPYEG